MTVTYAVIPTRYTDRNGYHADDHVTVENLTPDLLARLATVMADRDGEYVPTQVGLPHNGTTAWSSFPRNTDDDHVWQTILLADVTYSPFPPTDGNPTHPADQVVAAFEAAMRRDGADEP